MRILRCSVCDVEFGLSESYSDKRRADHRTFYCPNGHHQHYGGESDEDKIARLQNQLRNCQTLNDQRKRTIIAMQGHKTRLKQKIEQLEASKK